jgi:hypothetical protein
MEPYLRAAGLKKMVRKMILKSINALIGGL